ncbi:ATP-grasp domain-containing protein [Virgibacillus halodenitrificans]|uniref:ATP-grasp domain-containing protein n=1 Tax=Virgibacillus halodenitrificans TaxID=1482 RepID=UPI000EF4F403|nr:ATP-grasp domain-containing protein [Virgibacillus halodenitrificans]
MSIVIMNRLPINIVDFKEWLEDSKETCYYILPANKKDDFKKEGYNNIFVINDYYNNSEMMHVLKEINELDRLNIIIAIDEVDIERAGFFREYFNINNGQNLFSAVAYRDKFWMKEIIKSSNIPVPAYREIKNTDEAISFSRQYGYPVVLKPKNGMGSMGVHKVNSEMELCNTGFENVHMIEQYIDFENMYSVDGLVINNEVFFASVCRYNQSTIDYIDEGNVSIIEIVDPKEEIHSRLLDANKQIISSLPKSKNAFSFHTEIFHSTDDKLIFCETASRAGGARIVEAINQSYGIQLEECTVKLQSGIWTNNSISISSTPNFLSAVILIPKREGKVRKIPSTIPFRWVTEYQPRVKVGDCITGVNHSSDTIASLIVTGNTKEELWDNINCLKEYLLKEIDILQVVKQ